MTDRILVTGFRKFGGLDANPSEEVVRRLAAAPPRGLEIETLVLPVEYGAAFPPVRAVLDARRVAAVVHLGVAANRATIDVERFAVNWRGGPQADEAGVTIAGDHVDHRGPAGIESTLPPDRLVAAIRAAGAPAQTSAHAGTFLCNQVLYQTLRHAQRRKLRVRAVFIHLPLPGPEGGRPTLDALTSAVVAALREVARVVGPGVGPVSG